MESCLETSLTTYSIANLISLPPFAQQLAASGVGVWQLLHLGNKYEPGTLLRSAFTKCKTNTYKVEGVASSACGAARVSGGGNSVKHVLIGNRSTSSS